MPKELKAQLAAAMSRFLIENDGHPDRPKGWACDGLERMMTDAAWAVYEASHAGAVKQREYGSEELDA